MEIATACARGEHYQQIAEYFGIAPSTVRTHLTTIYRKLRVSSKIELHKVLEGEKTKSKTSEEQAMLISELALGLEEAISRERAVSEVLSIISRAGGDVQEVISAVLGYTLELCDAQFGILFSYNPKRGFKATYIKEIPLAFQTWLAEHDWFQVSPNTGLGRMVSAADIINIGDVRGEEIYRHGDPLRDATANLGGARSFTAIPMLSKDGLIGAFTIYRQQVRPFDDRSLRLASIFADQSVIAIENARLVSEVRSAKGE
ncbi:MAG: histidine kinase [Sneathiella sp.]|nr:histidine kinase [Sneathiella sp.]